MEDREARLRTALAVLREKRLLGRSLKPAEEEALFSLDAVERCEDDARRRLDELDHPAPVAEPQPAPVTAAAS